MRPPSPDRAAAGGPWIRRAATGLLATTLLLPPLAGRTAAADTDPGTATRSTVDLLREARPSLVTLEADDRDGGNGGLGSGFVISSDGRVVTCLHVIGEGRPVTVRLADGRRLPVRSVEAWDRHDDLAVLRVYATGLTPLPLGSREPVEAGTDVVALGNPLGLEQSVVAGVVSGRRTIEEVELLQVALPIEPGNSGGPLLDRTGRVVGIVNAKSLLTRNLGFAVPVDRLHALLDRPNPVPMDRWVRLGGIDPDAWESHLGAAWRRKGGRLLVDGPGTGFGGRAYLLSRTPAPEAPYDVSVRVRLDDESGAAGLVFLGDESGRHYGFYPTGGQLRLTAFEGPDVFTWRILGTVPSEHYRPGDWNDLRVEVREDSIRCLVNGRPVFTSGDRAFRGVRAGLAKFRDTLAQFADFRVGPPVPAGSELPPGLAVALGTGPRIPLGPADLEALDAAGGVGHRALLEAARSLEQEATALRRLADEAHRRSVARRLADELAREEPDLLLAALLVALHDQPGLDPKVYRDGFEALAGELRERIPSDADPERRMEILRRFLFEENGFHGSRHEYHHPANSHLNAVLDDREGLPITLSVVVIELARRAGIPGVHGLPLPGHFLVRHAPPGRDPRLYDPFNGGRRITHSDADELGSGMAGVPVRSEFLRPATVREIVVRMVTNLQAFTRDRDGAAAALPYQDLLVAIAGEPRAEAAQRIDRARTLSGLGRPEEAARDLEWILQTAPAGIDLDPVDTLRRRLLMGSP